MGGRSRRRQAYNVQVDYYVPTPVRVSRLLKTVERLDILSRAVLQLGSEMAAAVTQCAGFASKVQGYQVGGWTTASANRTLIQKMPFTTEVFAPSGTSLGAPLRDHVGLEVTGFGYIVGGRNGATRQTAIQKYNTGTDALAAIGASLSTGRNLAAGAGNTAKAAIAGGNGDSGVLNTVEILTYATDLIAPGGSNLGIASGGLAAASSNKQGIFAGGTGGSNAELSVQTFDFSDDSVILRGVQLSRERNFDGDSAFSDYLPVA